ncbi:MAG: hypothetical protein DMG60_10350, partial [Acidobacteria bacterium]
STTTNTEKLLATVAADVMVAGGSNTVCFNDSVGGAAGASPFSADATGGATFQGPITAQGLTLTGGSALAVPSLNINGDGNMTKNPRASWTGYLGATSNSANVVFSQWSNSTPLKITTINVIALSAPAGCTTAAQFFVHDVAGSSNSTAAVVANGSGSGSATGLSFSASAGDTIQLMYTAAGCTTQAQLVNVTVEVEPQ